MASKQKIHFSFTYTEESESLPQKFDEISPEIFVPKMKMRGVSRAVF
jgi:hypothetical protein